MNKTCIAGKSRLFKDLLFSSKFRHFMNKTCIAGKNRLFKDLLFSSIFKHFMKNNVHKEKKIDY